MPGVIRSLSTVAFQINACKTSPDLITRPLITHVAGGRRRRVVGLGAERQGGGGSLVNTYYFVIIIRATCRAEEETPTFLFSCSLFE